MRSFKARSKRAARSPSGTGRISVSGSFGSVGYRVGQDALPEVFRLLGKPSREYVHLARTLVVERARVSGMRVHVLYLLRQDADELAEKPVQPLHNGAASVDADSPAFRVRHDGAVSSRPRLEVHFAVRHIAALALAPLPSEGEENGDEWVGGRQFDNPSSPPVKEERLFSRDERDGEKPLSLLVSDEDVLLIERRGGPTDSRSVGDYRRRLRQTFFK